MMRSDKSNHLSSSCVVKRSIPPHHPYTYINLPLTTVNLVVKKNEIFSTFLKFKSLFVSSPSHSPIAKIPVPPPIPSAKVPPPPPLPSAKIPVSPIPSAKIPPPPLPSNKIPVHPHIPKVRYHHPQSMISDPHSLPSANIPIPPPSPIATIIQVSGLL